MEKIGGESISNLFLTYSYDEKIYKFLKGFGKIPYLIPNISYPISIEFENIDINGSSDMIKIFICKEDQSKPLISVKVAMPISELKID